MCQSVNGLPGNNRNLYWTESGLCKSLQSAMLQTVRGACVHVGCNNTPCFFLLPARFYLFQLFRFSPICKSCVFLLFNHVAFVQHDFTERLNCSTFWYFSLSFYHSACIGSSVFPCLHHTPFYSAIHRLTLNTVCPRFASPLSTP